ncbi:MAG: hypothetical protein PHP95_08650 [Desulfuromonadaceae bacterium]|nr:hypothetical protein [Desulfuromonadaceae bacterium]MDD2848510.1 hypothetical protein [Desulfuromonadaceae bacterium]MDD4129861.1 hypothetical protein [Desulfuromonadaceae bacterium]
MNNHYVDDAVFFLKNAAIAVDEKTTDEQIVFAVLSFALGMEKLLKGILFDVNPVYVYKVPDFKNTVSLLYKEKMLPNVLKNQEISSDPDGDVLTFKLSLLRAKAISETTEKHTSLLFSLSNYRDIIVHNTLNLLESAKLRKLILGNFYPMILDYCKELGIRPDKIFAANEIKMADVSAKNQDSPEGRIKLKIAAHLKRWEQLKNMSGYIEKKSRRTDYIKTIRNRNLFFKITECPACKNDSLMKVEVDLEEFDDRLLPVGAFVSGLNCQYCKFTVDDYDEIDYLKLNEHLVPEDIGQESE